MKNSSDSQFKKHVQEIRERSKGPWAQNKKRPFSANNDSFSYGRVGVEFASGVIAGVLLGLGIDSFFGIAPWGIILFFILGSCAGFYNVYRIVNKR